LRFSFVTVTFGYVLGDVRGYASASSCRHDLAEERHPARPTPAADADRPLPSGGVVTVISIAKLRGGMTQAHYYLQRGADCHPSGYYTDERELDGRWCGHGATAIGLTGPVTADQAAVFAGLLDGVLPDGTVAAGPVWRRDPKNPDGPKIDIRRSGLDVVVSPPKSVSVLFALAGPAVSAAVVAAHEHAVTEALDYLERHAGHGLRGHQGDGKRASRIGTDGLVAAAFTHRTSREDDPQLHTHLVVANLVHGVDGNWSALDSRAFYYQARTAGCVYQAVLRGELTRTLGVAWDPVGRGVAEITGIPKRLRKEFSTRREEIDAELDRTGGSGRRAAQRAAYVTRPPKSHTPVGSLRASWASRTSGLGYDPELLVADVLDRVESPALPDDHVLSLELFGPAGLTEHRTSFDRRDAIQALTETIPTGAQVTGELLEAVTDQLLESEEAVPLLQPTLVGCDRRWSTQNLIVAERWALAAVTLRTTITPLTPEQARHVSTVPRMSDAQQRVVAGLLTSSDLVDVVVGPAGSGKTAALRIAAEEWTRRGVPVVGCALAAITARRLESATTVPSMSLKRLLMNIDRVDPSTGWPAGLAAGTVVLCDEASMVGTRQFVELTRAVATAGGKLVAIGDPEQLAEIDAGGMFAALARSTQPLVLTGNQRQIASWETAALTRLRDGNLDAALDSYIAHGRIHLGGNDRNVRQLLADHYVEQYVDGGEVVALASSRRETNALNAAIREAMRAVGEISPDLLTITGEDGDRRYAAGDQVIVTRNDHQLGLLNGTRGVLIDVDNNALTLMPDHSNDTVSVTPAWAADHLDHGYAMTVHKAQGLTTKVALLYGSAALCQQAGYVGMSRGTDANHLFASATALTPEAAGVEVDVPSFELMTGPDPDEVLDRLRERLAVSTRHTLASDQQPQWTPRVAEPEPYWLALPPDPGRDLGHAR
jgi:conjugative relaxase-like TrwC/TraI family protein